MLCPAVRTAFNPTTRYSEIGSFFSFSSSSGLLARLLQKNCWYWPKILDSTSVAKIQSSIACKETRRVKSATVAESCSRHMKPVERVILVLGRSVDQHGFESELSGNRLRDCSAVGVRNPQTPALICYKLSRSLTSPKEAPLPSRQSCSMTLVSVA